MLLQWADHMENDSDGGQWVQGTGELSCGIWLGSVDPETYEMKMMETNTSSEMIFRPQTSTVPPEFLANVLVRPPRHTTQHVPPHDTHDTPCTAALNMLVARFNVCPPAIV